MKHCNRHVGILLLGMFVCANPAFADGPPLRIFRADAPWQGASAAFGLSHTYLVAGDLKGDPNDPPTGALLGGPSIALPQPLDANQISTARSISPDGRYLAGSTLRTDGTIGAMIWDTATQQSQWLPDIGSSTFGVVTGLSEGAGIAVGRLDHRAAAWTGATTQWLSNGAFSGARAVTPRGDVIVGYSGPSYNALRAVIWTSSGEQALPLPESAVTSVAVAVSSAGDVIAGYSMSPSDQLMFTRWTRDLSTGAFGVATLEAYRDALIFPDSLPELPAAVSPDGSVVGGLSSAGPALWWEASGAVPLNTLMPLPGLNEGVFEWVWPADIVGLGPDNRTVVGNAVVVRFGDVTTVGNYGFQLTIPAPATAITLALSAMSIGRRTRVRTCALRVRSPGSLLPIE